MYLVKPKYTSVFVIVELIDYEIYIPEKSSRYLLKRKCTLVHLASCSIKSFHEPEPQS